MDCRIWRLGERRGLALSTQSPGGLKLSQELGHDRQGIALGQVGPIEVYHHHQDRASIQRLDQRGDQRRLAHAPQSGHGDRPSIGKRDSGGEFLQPPQFARPPDQPVGKCR